LELEFSNLLNFDSLDFEEGLKRRMLNYAIGVIRLVEKLPSGQTSGVLGKQLVRCSTSIGANYRGACKAKSKADFIAKLAIAEEEADESQYWLELLASIGQVSDKDFKQLHTEAMELTAILASSGKTAKLNR